MIMLPPELGQFLAEPRLLRHCANTIPGRSTSATWVGKDGNLSTWTTWPPEMAAKKYVEYMGESDRGYLRQGQDRLRQGQLPLDGHGAQAGGLRQSRTARTGKQPWLIQLEQMGYQAESGPWRAVYLKVRLRVAQWRAEGRRHQYREP